jgi:hypothetical protein
MSSRKIRGIVRNIFVKDDNEVSILIEIDEKTAAELRGVYDAKIENPLKDGEGELEGKVLYKAHTKYPVNLYMQGDPVGTENNDETIEEIRKIGNGSAVTIRVREQLDGRYKSKKFQSAYLKAINVREFVEADPFMDFDEDDN